jgi:CheY-like chemotaxis protein
MVEIEQDGTEAVVRVRDNGYGIEPELLARVFELFFRAGDAPGGEANGLGVGLARVKKLVELHGGRFERREFIVRLPLAPPIPSVEEPMLSEIPSRVLIIDDDKDVVDSLVMLLEYFGAEVRSAHDGVSGVDAAVSFQPHIAFVDLRMPGIDGLETARRIRLRLTDRTPFLVALTGLGQSQDRMRTREAGFDLHITKPASADTLEQVLLDRGFKPGKA